MSQKTVPYKMTTLPKSFKKYFWDCNFNEITLDTYSFFITERILRYGNMDSVNWLLNKIDKKFLKIVIKKSRNLDNKTKNYWETILR
jgi:hypothetical protein